MHYLSKRGRLDFAALILDNADSTTHIGKGERDGYKDQD